MNLAVLAHAVIWAAVSFIAWLALIAVMSRLGVREPVVVAAVLSWLVAGLVIWSAPTVAHWMQHLFVT
jgi:hypothetical protein